MLMSAKCSFGFVIAKLWEFVSCAPVGVTSADVRVSGRCAARHHGVSVSSRPPLRTFSMNRAALCAEAKFIPSVITLPSKYLHLE